MSTSWRGRKEPTAGELLLVNWVLVLLRGIPVAIVVFGGLIFFIFPDYLVIRSYHRQKKESAPEEKEDSF